MKVPDDCAVRDAMLRSPTVLPATASVDDVRRGFASPKVLVALLVADDGRLLTVIERDEASADLPGDIPALALGGLLGRSVLIDCPLPDARARLDETGGRRLAVIDDQGHLVGLLCLNRTRTGYCSDDDVNARVQERAKGAGDTPREPWR